MPKYRKKPVVIEATQWSRNGDHPLDASQWGSFKGEDREGEVVRRYRRPDDTGARICQYCSDAMFDHGWIDTLEGGHIVCPGDWIITGVKGEFYPCKPDIFDMTYDLA